MIEPRILHVFNNLVNRTSILHLSPVSRLLEILASDSMFATPSSGKLGLLRDRSTVQYSVGTGILLSNSYATIGRYYRENRDAPQEMALLISAEAIAVYKSSGNTTTPLSSNAKNVLAVGATILFNLQLDTILHCLCYPTLTWSPNNLRNSAVQTLQRTTSKWTRGSLLRHMGEFQGPHLIALHSWSDVHIFQQLSWWGSSFRWRGVFQPTCISQTLYFFLSSYLSNSPFLFTRFPKKLKESSSIVNFKPQI